MATDATLLGPDAAAPGPVGPYPGSVTVPARLSDTLGLGGHRYFLLQHELISMAHTYRVLDREKNHLFTVRETAHADPMVTFGQPIGQPHLGIQRVEVGPGSHNSQWEIPDPGSTPVGGVTIRETAGHAVSVVTDASGAPHVFVNIEHSGLDKLLARAETPNGQHLFESAGTVFSHNFDLHAEGGQELAKVHEAWASVRDTFELEITGPVDHFFPVIFAILVDDDKGRNRPQAPAHHGPPMHPPEHAGPGFRIG